MNADPFYFLEFDSYDPNSGIESDELFPFLDFEPFDEDVEVEKTGKGPFDYKV